MTTTEQRLADALRAILPFAERDVGELLDLVRDDDSETEASEASEALWAARAALAAYDAHQAQDVVAGAWSANAGSIWDHTGRWIADCDSENAARIVACVNAHDALVSALQNALPYVDKVRDFSGGDGDITAMNARAIIARVESAK